MAQHGAGNGGGNGNGNATLPNVGEQMDMNVLWDLVNQLAETQQGLREQTQGVMQRVQMIQARGLDVSAEADGAGHAGNGEVNGKISHYRDFVILIIL
jgi:hypothetical protein